MGIKVGKVLTQFVDAAEAKRTEKSIQVVTTRFKDDLNVIIHYNIKF